MCQYRLLLEYDISFRVLKSATGIDLIHHTTSHHASTKCDVCSNLSTEFRPRIQIVIEIVINVGNHDISILNIYTKSPERSRCQNGTVLFI